MNTLQDQAGFKPRRFVSLTIEQLFGPQSHTIEIDFRLDARVTILHGRNGSGKTITLSLIEALSAGRFAEFHKYPFRRFDVHFSDNTRLEFVTDAAAERRIRFLLHDEEGKLKTEGTLPQKVSPRNPSRFIRDVQRRLPWLRQLAEDSWLDEETGRLLTADLVSDLLRRDPSHLGGELLFQSPESILAAFCTSLPKVRFIRTDRLLDQPRIVRQNDTPTSGRRERIVNRSLMVERISQDIKREVRNADRAYRIISTKLDSNLAQRLFQPQDENPSVEDLKRRYALVRDQERRLNELGLVRLGFGPVHEEALTDEQSKTFAIILKDLEEKLTPFKRVADRAQKLLESLNQKLAPKSVRLDLDTGYQVLSADGTPLPLDSLSSGEQHQLVLLHEFLFEVQEGTLILIDEPELSLHVTWQTQFLPDLLLIAELSNLDFVLATHSPYIVGDHRELLVRLGEPIEAEE